MQERALQALCSKPDCCTQCMPTCIARALRPDHRMALVQVVTETQGVVMEFLGNNFLLSISQVMVKDRGGTVAAAPRGRLQPATAFVYNAASGSGINIAGQRNIAAPKLFKAGASALCCESVCMSSIMLGRVHYKLVCPGGAHAGRAVGEAAAGCEEHDAVL